MQLDFGFVNYGSIESLVHRSKELACLIKDLLAAGYTGNYVM